MAAFTIYRDKAGEFRWRLEGSNDRIIAESPEGYKNRSDCRDEVDRVRRDAPVADVIDETQK